MACFMARGMADEPPSTSPEAGAQVTWPSPPHGWATDSPRIERAALRTAIHTANAYLHLVIDKKGKFLYRFNLDSSTSVSPSYNLLRHAGTIYAMATHERLRGDGTDLPDILRAAGFLKRVALQAAENDKGNDTMLAIWSHPEITHSRKPAQVKLGGVGLGLVALASVEALSPGFTSRDSLRALGEFALYLQKEDGSFYSKYIPAQGGRDDSWTSLYYPGEAALGLVMLYELDSDPRWLLGAARALAYLARLRKGQQRVEADHWALLATARLLPQYNQLLNPPAPRQQLIEHAMQVCESMLAEAYQHLDDPGNTGHFTRTDYTTPTATRLEGLQAALDILPHTPAYRAFRGQLETTIDRGIQFLLRAQIQEGDHRGAFLRNAYPPPAPSGVYRPPSGRATEFRIDYVQHALSALMQYQQRQGW